MSDKHLLESSLELVASAEPRVVGRFYERLFEMRPDFRALFGRRSSEAQEKMLLEAISAVVANVEDGEWLDRNLRALGAKHVDYGVTDDMYPVVAEALLATLSDIAGPAWDDTLAGAWTRALTAVASTMIAGADDARAAAAAE